MRRSTLAWLATMGLTAASGLALWLEANALSPTAWLAVLAAVTLAKGRLILLDFLKLRGAPTWRRAIVAGFAAAVLLVAALLALTPA